MHRTKFAFTIKTLIIIIFILLIGMFSISFVSALTSNNKLSGNLKLTVEEEQLLASYKDRTLLLGLDPLAGMEYFTDGDSTEGYMISFVDFLERNLNLDIKIVDDQSWAQVYDGLHQGKIDLLFGANPTPERLQTMTFTKPIYSVPYTVLAKRGTSVQTIGDLYGKRVGFIQQDVGLELFKTTYEKIAFNTILYPDQYAALEALEAQEIDSFVTSGGDIVYDYIYDFPNLKEVARIESIRSELTISSLKTNEALVALVQRVMDGNQVAIKEMIDDARQLYVRKIVNLTAEEKEWLLSEPTIKVGVATDYLPIDYYEDNQYQGISGYYLTTFANLIGIEIEPVPGSFDEVYSKALKGDIDIINMAKTEERMANFIFTDAYSDERDLIYGLRSTPYVNDIYGLEGKRVGVIEGFWHDQYLQRNLRDVEIIRYQDIKEVLNAIVMRKVDYFLETPAVAEFYTYGLGYTNVIKKGETSADSFLYFGAQKSMAHFVSIFNKMRPLLSYSEAKYFGAQSVPPLENVANSRLIILLIGTLVTIALLTFSIIRIVRKMSKQSSEMLLLKERERLLYLDPLTELYNRNYFNHIEPKMDENLFPQYLIMADLNDLKVVNDQYGHLVGDQLIKQFSQIFNSLDSDAVAIRMGGDEFVLLIKGQTEAEIQSLIQRLRFKCQHSIITESKSSDVPLVNGIHVSLGYSVRHDVTKSVEQCLKEADIAMYQDKIHLKVNMTRSPVETAERP